MPHDPAASYRRRTPRQRAQAENRFNREAAAVIAQATAQRTAKARAAYVERQRGILTAAEFVLSRATLKGLPLTRAQRATIEKMAADARRAIARGAPSTSQEPLP